MLTINAFRNTIRRSAGRLVVRPCKHLREKSEKNELNAENKKEHRKERKRRIDEIRSRELEEYRPERDEPAQENTDDPERPEKMHRPSEVGREKKDRDEIQEPAQGPADTILGNAGMTRTVLNRKFGDTKSFFGRKNREKSVHIAVQGKSLQYFPPIHFEPAVEVM